MQENERVGIILANTGTTAAPRTAETRAYLREFLSDPRVIDIPAWKRWLILNLFILPFRPKQSAEAYAAVWTDEGSPLLAIGERQRKGLQERLPHAAIAIGMRYGKPSIPEAMETLLAQHVDRILVAPLFPQYSSAATGSVLECVYGLAGKRWNVPSLSALPPFYQEPHFLDAWEAVAGDSLADFREDHVLMSYHGLPERQVRKSDPSGKHCFAHAGCCEAIGAANRDCYRAQCFATSRLLAGRLGLSAADYTVSFQSRLGRDPWIQPATDATVPALAKRGVKRLAVMCPAFVTDCLETIEEIGMRARDSFLEAGGEAFHLVPCLNDHPAWLDALAALLKRL